MPMFLRKTRLPPGTRAPSRSFCARDNASTADQLTAEATLATDRFLLRQRAIHRWVLHDRGGFPHLESPLAVLATLAPDPPKHFPLCVRVISSLATRLDKQVALRFEPVGLCIARQSKSASAFGNEVGSQTNGIL